MISFKQYFLLEKKRKRKRTRNKRVSQRFKHFSNNRGAYVYGWGYGGPWWGDNGYGGWGDGGDGGGGGE